MFKTKYILIICLLLVTVSGYAQQIPQYSQYLLNDYVINPAVAGTRNFAEVKSNNRYQWSGITDAPRTYILSLNGPIAKEKMGLGGYVFTDIVGPTRRNGAYGSYSYHLNLTDDIKLGLGLSVGVLQFAIDASKITMKDNYDVAISNNYQSIIDPDASFGSYLYHKDFYFGFTVNQLLNNRIKFFDNNNNNSSRLVFHYTACGGYRYALSDKIKIEPSVFVKYVQPVPVQVDGSLRFILEDKYWVGATYRTGDAISAMVGVLMSKNIMFGYAYDYSTTNLRNYSSGTHEIMLGLRFIQKRAVPSVAPPPVTVPVEAVPQN